MRYEEMTALAATSPPGANGVLFTPWLAGERSPIGNKHLRGGFTNLSLDDVDAPISCARCSEGVAANSAWLVALRREVRRSRADAAASARRWRAVREWCQIYADALGRDVEQVPEPMVAQLRGAALLAAVSLGSPPPRRRRRAFGPAVAPSRPNGDVAELYRARREQFPSLYTRDKKWSRRR